MIIVGLTGGIASGKSAVAKYLKHKKIPVHDSDKVVKAVYRNKKPEFVLYLKKIGLGESVLKKRINKKIIRNEIFSSLIKKQKLEKYLHMKVKKERNIFLKKNINKDIVFLEVALLFENNLEKICNYICSTIAPEKLREKRALKRKGMTKEIFKKIIKNQTNDKERKKKSNYLINTSINKNKTYLQVDRVIHNILKKGK